MFDHHGAKQPAAPHLILAGVGEVSAGCSSLSVCHDRANGR
jgi:hypothetical protein